MKLTDFFRDQLDREIERSRKALEQVPDGKYDWKPRTDDCLFALDGCKGSRSLWTVSRRRQFLAAEEN